MKNFYACHASTLMKTVLQRDLDNFTSTCLVKPMLLVVAVLFFSVNVKAQYCTPTHSNSYSGVSVFQVRNSNGTTTLYTRNTPNGQEYGFRDYTSLGSIIDLTPGTTYRFYITDNCAYSDYLGIWIDLNNGGTFENTTDEFLGSAIINGASCNTAVTWIQWTVPAGAAGVKRLRIRTRNATEWAGGNACANTTAGGATHDYLINIQPPCTNPQISTHPASASWCAGGQASLSVSVSSPASGLSYQWKKNNVNISGATSATYTVNAVTLADAGSYTVEIKHNNSFAVNGPTVTTDGATNITNNGATLNGTVN